MTLTTTMNMIVNPGGEVDDPFTQDYGWSVPGGFGAQYSVIEASYASNDYPDLLNQADSDAIGGGAGYFAGGPDNPNPNSPADLNNFQWQDLNVKADATAIDAGSVQFDVDGYFGGYLAQNDTMSLHVYFLTDDQDDDAEPTWSDDMAANSLGEVTIGGFDAADRGNVTKLMEDFKHGAVPAGTRHILLVLEADYATEAGNGSYNDGYADNLYFSLSGDNLHKSYVAVSDTHDYSNDVLDSSLIGIRFANVFGPATATFQASQFGGKGIGLSGTIIDNAYTDAINIELGSRHSFDASHLLFQDWTSGTDIFRIDGSTGADTIIGPEFVAATLSGGDGNDVLRPDPFTPTTLDGGLGSDTADLTKYSINHLGGTVQLAGATPVTVYGGPIGGGLKDANMVLEGIENIWAGPSADHLIGDSADNLFRGGGGKDVLDGGGGKDTADYSDKTTPVVATLTIGTVTNVTVGGVVEDTIVNFENLTGGTANDTLTGDSLANRLDGGPGGDTMAGGGGNDTYFVDNTLDRVKEAKDGGTADLVKSTISYDLASNVENLSLIGTQAIDGTGNGLANVIVGNGEANVIDGGGGNDKLTGGGGADIFLFDTKPNATSNFDTITDFTPGGTDRIMLSLTYFAGIGTVGTAMVDHFRSGAHATHPGDFIIYDPATGFLSYDSDGNGDHKPVHFATLAEKLVIHDTDLLVSA